MLAVKDGNKNVFVFIEDFLYVPSAGCNLFSSGLAIDQGLDMGQTLQKHLGLSKIKFLSFAPCFTRCEREEVYLALTM